MNWIIMPYVDLAGMTLTAITDCLAQTVPKVRVLAIDNGSRADSVVEVHDPRVFQWHHHPPIPALGGTWNLALRTMWEAGQDHALVVNNDVRLPRGTYEALLQVQRETGAWFVSAVNVGQAWYAGMLEQAAAVTESLKASRGGPDFSCFLMTRECHKWFQFDEGFIPAYHEDNDYHRRLILAGFGEKIFSVPVPYLHYGSATCNRSLEVRAAWGDRFKVSQDYYREKWGGLPHKETHVVPFGYAARDGELGFADPRVLYTGQGKPGNWGFGAKTLFGLPAEDALA